MFDKYQLVIYIYTYYIIEFCECEEQLNINSIQDWKVKVKDNYIRKIYAYFEM